MCSYLKFIKSSSRNHTKLYCTLCCKERTCKNIWLTLAPKYYWRTLTSNWCTQDFWYWTSTSWSCNLQSMAHLNCISTVLFIWICFKLLCGASWNLQKRMVRTCICFWKTLYKSVHVQAEKKQLRTYAITLGTFNKYLKMASVMTLLQLLTSSFLEFSLEDYQKNWGTLLKIGKSYKGPLLCNPQFHFIHWKYRKIRTLDLPLEINKVTLEPKS